MKALRIPLLLAGCMFLLAVPSSAQDDPLAWFPWVHEPVTIKVPVEVEGWNYPFERCLEYCVEKMIIRDSYECSPVMAPPTTRCDLPWITPGRPTGLPPWNPMEWCIPEQGAFVGYHLHEEHNVIRQMIRHQGCETTIEEEIVDPVDGPGKPRACPDGGPWVEERETTLGFQIVPCG